MGLFGRGPKKTEKPVLGRAKKEPNKVTTIEQRIRIDKFKTFNSARQNFEYFLTGFKKIGNIGTAENALKALYDMNSIKPGDAEIRSLYGQLAGAMGTARNELIRKRDLQGILKLDELRLLGAVEWRQKETMAKVAEDYKTMANSARQEGKKNMETALFDASEKMKWVAQQLEKADDASGEFTVFFKGGKEEKEKTKREAIETAGKIFENLRNQLKEIGRI